MEQKDLTTFQSDINNIFVDTPEIMNVEILDKDIALIQASDELFSVDVRARNGMNQYFDIEIQGRNHGSFYDRAVLYAGIVAAEAHKDNGENYREEWGIYRKNDIGKKNALPVSDVIKYIFIKLPRVNFFKESIQPEELAWYDLIANSEKQREIPETASDPIRDAYERLRVGRTPKLILERQARDMIPSAMIDDLIDEAVDAKMRKLADDLLAMGKLTDDEISAVSGIPKEKLRENKG